MLKTLMTKKLPLSLLLVATANATSEPSFCEGYKAGYIAGFCSQKNQSLDLCLKPIPPLCPVSNFGFDTYEDGFINGFDDAQDK